MKHYSAIFIFVFGIATVLSSQRFSDYVNQNAPTHLDDIIVSFENEIGQLDSTNRQKLRKHFYRRVHSYEANLDKYGNLINYGAMNLKALKKANKQFAQQTQSLNRSNTGDWELISPPTSNIGHPTQGRVLRIAGHPTQPNTIFAGMPHGGLWKTTNQGASWSNLTTGFINISISGIVIRETNPSHIYILTGDGDSYDYPSLGIFKSTNGGIDWVETSLNFGLNELEFGNQLKAHPMNANVMYAATNRGLYKTTNSWNSHGDVFDTGNWRDIEFAPGSMDTMYACTNNWFYRSIDGGQSFQHITQIDNLDPNFNPNRTTIAVSPSDPNIVYVVMTWNTDPNGGDYGHREIYISYDYGASFTLMSQAGDLGKQSTSNLALIVDPSNSANVFLGGVPLMRSLGFGVTFSESGTQGPGYDVHADIHDFIFHGGQLYAATDGGVSRSGDLGNTWTDASYGLAITQFYDIDVYNNQFFRWDSR